jgi:hypothetical protein
LLRDGALSDSRVIAYVNDHLVPVWVNVREDRYPRVPALASEDWVLFTTDGGQVLNPYYYGFLARSYVLAPDLYTLLNEEDGVLGRATLWGGDYLHMLERAVGRFDAKKETARAAPERSGS